MRRFTTFLVASSVVAVLIAACGGGSNDGKTPTPSVSSTTTSSTRVASGTVDPRATPPADIRSIDISKVPDVVAMAEDTGGTFVKSDVLYADVTGDGADEAIVPLSSGGTMGYLAFLVLMADGDGTSTLLKESPSDQSGLAVEVKDGKIVMTQPVPGPDDPLCCPSFLKTTTFGWNGYAMAIEGVSTDPNPNGGAKGTPSPDFTPGVAPTPPPGLAPEGTAASGDRPQPPPPAAAP